MVQVEMCVRNHAVLLHQPAQLGATVTCAERVPRAPVAEARAVPRQASRKCFLPAFSGSEFCALHGNIPGFMHKFWQPLLGLPVHFHRHQSGQSCARDPESSIHSRKLRMLLAMRLHSLLPPGHRITTSVSCCATRVGYHRGITFYTARLRELGGMDLDSRPLHDWRSHCA